MRPPVPACQVRPIVTLGVSIVLIAHPFIRQRASNRRGLLHQGKC